MSAFRQLEGDTALLVSNGVYRQAPLFERAGILFAKWGTGFVRLTFKGGTSNPNIRFDELVYDGPLFADQFERMAIEPATNRKPLLPRPGALPELAPPTEKT